MSNELSYLSIGTIKAKLDNVLKQIETEDFIPFFESMKGRYSDGLYSRSLPALRVQRISKIEDLNIGCLAPTQFTKIHKNAWRVDKI